MKIYSYNKGFLKEYKNLIDALNINFDKDKIITVVGAGGKTSTIYKLSEEISNLDKKVIVTTTTHMKFDKDFIVVKKEEDLNLVKESLMKNNVIKIAKKESEYKVCSMDIDLIKKAIPMADFVLIEGDGSKNLPLKAPRKNEPVIIEDTNLVIGLIGFDCLNKKIKDVCHRPELVSKLLKKNLDEIVEYEDLIKIAKSKNGLSKNVNCKYKVIINKVDDKEKLEECKKIGELFEKEEIEVIFTSYKNIFLRKENNYE